MTADTSPPLILLGGTFDPPHIGHLVLAECVRVQLGAGHVVFLPAGDPWRKTSNGEKQRTVTPAVHRLKMVQLAIADNPAFLLDDRETRRAGPTYTVDTLDELYTEGRTNLVLVLGADALADMPHWDRAERIPHLATLAVAPRDAGLAADRDIVPIDMPPLAITSTGIRQRVAMGKPIRYLVPDAVEAYISQHRLYRE